MMIQSEEGPGYLWGGTRGRGGEEESRASSLDGLATISETVQLTGRASASRRRRRPFARRGHPFRGVPSQTDAKSAEFLSSKVSAGRPRGAPRLVLGYSCSFASPSRPQHKGACDCPNSQ